MNRRDCLIALIAASLPPVALAQAQPKVPRIGILGGSAEIARFFKDFLRGMAELGYQEGKNVRYEQRHGDGTLASVIEKARELAAANVDLIWAPGTQVVAAARKVTTTTPIVFALVSDPVAAGFARTLAHPGGNATGLTVLNSETAAKRVELLNEIFPNLQRVGVLHNPGDSASAAQLAIVERSLRSLGKESLVVEVRAAGEFAPAFARLAGWRADSLVILENALFVAHRKALLDSATAHRWPTINSSKEYAEAGGVISYGADWGDSCRRSAVYVDKILKGAKPGDLPIEQPTKFELVINMRAAKALGVSIPKAVLVRADRVIE